jgi:hypothetical protein
LFVLGRLADRIGCAEVLVLDRRTRSRASAAARAASGDAAAPPRSVMNVRRLMSNMGAILSLYATLPRIGPQVLRADLNCSES